MVEQVKTKTEPYVRFRGFDDEWEQVKLGDVVNIRGGGTPKTDVPEYWGGDVQWFTPSEVNSETKFVSESERTITEKGLIHSSAKILPKGSILLTTRASLGDMSILNVDAATNQGFQSLIPTERIDLEFLYGFQKQLKKYCETHANGSTFLEINKHEVGKFKLGLPSLPEQQKIGELFQTLDKTIDLSNTHVENLKQQKNALLQHLFPQKGETSPNVRLRGFTVEWEEVKLGDVATFSKGKGLTKDSFSDEGVPCLHYGELFTTYEDNINSVNTFTDIDGDSMVYSDGCEVLVPSSSTVADKAVTASAINIPDVMLGGDINIIKPDSTLNNSFLSLLINYGYRNKAWALVQTGTITHLYNKDLKHLKIRIPSLDEQQAIGELFQTLDEQIRLAEDKVKQYKELKQALLQRLLV